MGDGNSLPAAAAGSGRLGEFTRPRQCVVRVWLPGVMYGAVTWMRVAGSLDNECAEICAAVRNMRLGRAHNRPQDGSTAVQLCSGRCRCYCGCLFLLVVVAVLRGRVGGSYSCLEIVLR